ncbi:MAG TPA: hypothetical protein VNG33_21260, partial [Polyangiaceae bacterium]|nr:hypothetical protein [Polyangiaceae bacterium]
IDKVDLLLVVDNSISMADKQQLLAQALPLLVMRLVTPRCVAPCTDVGDCTAVELRDGRPTNPPEYADAQGRCAVGHPEMPPLKDLHVGVVSSSLGSHGASGAKDVCVRPQDDDHAHLLGQLRKLPGTYNDLGFLAWNVSHTAPDPQADVDPQVFTKKFSDMVQAAGEQGCGYESTLEAWYRFLIDPEPPLSVVLNGSVAVVQGLDNTVLSQRQAFLRPDSLVAIVMLTDENDCSIQDEGYGWLISSSTMPMFRSTSQCQVNPNDVCCQSCAESAAHPGCAALSSDSECAKGQTLAPAADDLNLRCWDQKRRFGFDLLYPTTRYSEALRSPNVVQRSDGSLVGNPLFTSTTGFAPRDRGLVFLEGIVGVPWQDLADDQSVTGPGLRFLTETQLETTGRWDLILGQSNQGTNDSPVPPTDPFMRETAEERSAGARNPITGDMIVSSTSMNPRANAINGHEQVNAGSRDLQYACTFPLAKPRVCDPTSDVGCDCNPDDAAYNRPLCQPPMGGPAGTTQYYAKAYPGLRLLQVLKEFKDNAIVASACPKVMDETNPDYGYNPAVNALVDRVKEDFRARCLARPLPVVQNGENAGRVPCVVMEALTDQPAACDCEALSRVSLADRPELMKAARQRLASGGVCGGSGGGADSQSCSSICLCELPQLFGPELASCQNDPTPPQTPGFCYVNAAPNETQVGNPALLESCSADTKRLVRFVGGAPTPGAITLIQCDGASPSP